VPGRGYESPGRRFRELHGFLQWRTGDAILLAEANIEPEETEKYFGPEATEVDGDMAYRHGARATIHLRQPVLQGWRMAQTPFEFPTPCIGIGILVPAGPGFFGAFQLSTYMALAMFFPEEALRGPGAAFVFLLYACQVGFHLVAAAIGLVLDQDAR
jgi:hypothetical protein